MSFATKRAVIGLGILALVLLLAAVSFALYSTVRLQQNLLSKGPSYDAGQLYSRAVEQVGQGDYVQAESYLEQAMQKQPDDSYRTQLAVVKYRLKKYSEAISQYQELIKDRQDPGFAYNGMGNAYRDWALSDAARQAEYRSKAEEAYRQALKADPQYVAAYSNLALLLDVEGRRDEAFSVLSQGVATTGSQELKGVLKTLGQS